MIECTSNFISTTFNQTKENYSNSRLITKISGAVITSIALEALIRGVSLLSSSTAAAGYASSLLGVAFACGILALNIIPGLLILGTGVACIGAACDKSFYTGKIVNNFANLAYDTFNPIIDVIGRATEYIFEHFMPVILYKPEWLIASFLLTATVTYITAPKVYAWLSGNSETTRPSSEKVS